MALDSGKYFIFSKIDDAPVGRSPVEDKTSLPKAIYKLPKDTEPSVWDVEKLPNGNYSFENRGAPVGATDGHLFAFLIVAEILWTTHEWSIQRDERNEDGNSYIITKAGDEGAGGEGWVVAEADDSQEEVQIAFRPLIAGRSLPPFYPPNEVFVFKKAE